MSAVAVQIMNKLGKYTIPKTKIPDWPSYSLKNEKFWKESKKFGLNLKRRCSAGVGSGASTSE